MRIEYECDDGSRTVARWPSIALLHWLGRSQPHPPIKNPEPFKIYIVGSPVPAGVRPVFLTLLYAEYEHRWNKTPPFEIIPPAGRPKQPAGDKFHHPPGGQAYQDRCLEVLHWLHQTGNIVKLRVEDDPE